MRKYIVHLNLFLVTDARDEDEARQIAEGVCEFKGFNKRSYRVGEIFEERREKQSGKWGKQEITPLRV